MRHRPRTRTPHGRRGFVLLAVLVVVVVLTLAAYQFSEMMMAEYKAADSAKRVAQAHAFADSGLSYAAALLANRDAVTTTLNGNPFNNPSAFQGIVVQDSDQPRNRGRFSLVAPLGPDDARGSQLYRLGVIDEAGKLNLNALMKLDSSGKVAHDILLKLPNMTEDVANSILDWMDSDSDPRSGGAEDDYYTTQSQPYHAKNGPLDSLDELLLVKGVTAQLLYGNDLNHNGQLDPEEDDGSGTFDPGWSAYLTVFTREQNVDAQGNPRININDNDLNTLSTKLNNALGSDLANFILAYRIYGPASTQQGQQGGGARGGAGGQRGGGGGGRGGRGGAGGAGGGAAGGARGGAGGGAGGGQAGGDSDADDQVPSGRGGRGGRGGRSSTPTLNLRQGGQRRIGSLYELINAKVEIPSQSNPNQKTTLTSPLASTNNQRQLLPLLLDETTTTTDAELPARVNLLTAPQAVLAALPNADDAFVQAVLDHRPGPDSTDTPDPIFQTPAWLVTEANVQPSVLQALEKYITSRTQVYRVQSVGYFDGGGPTVRLEAVIDTNGGRPRFLSWRDLTPLGKGFDMTAPQ